MLGTHVPKIMKYEHHSRQLFRPLLLNSLLKRTCESVDQSPRLLSHSANTLLAPGPTRLGKSFRMVQGPALRGQFLDCRVTGPVCAVLQLNALGIEVPTWSYWPGHLSVAKPSVIFKDTQLSHSVPPVSSTTLTQDSNTSPAWLPSTAAPQIL